MNYMQHNYYLYTDKLGGTIPYDYIQKEFLGHMIYIEYISY